MARTNKWFCVLIGFFTAIMAIATRRCNEQILMVGRVRYNREYSFMNRRPSLFVVLVSAVLTYEKSNF